MARPLFSLFALFMLTLHEPCANAQSPTPPPTVSLLIGYTREALIEAGSTAVLFEEIASSFHSTRLAFQNSGIPINLKLVGVVEASETESAEPGADLSAVVHGNGGRFAALRSGREATCADLLVVVTSSYGGTFCGLGWLYGGPPAHIRDTASLVSFSCLDTYSMQHELGHNLGAHHDRAHVTGPISDPHPFGYGYHGVGVDGTPFRDVMSYGTTRQVNIFSSPLISVHGAPAGTADNDAARVIADALPAAAGAFSCDVPPLPLPFTLYDDPATYPFITTISGTVTTLDGKPVGGAKVSLDPPQAESTSDREGRYTLRTLLPTSPRPVLVTVSSPDFAGSTLGVELGGEEINVHLSGFHLTVLPKDTEPEPVEPEATEDPPTPEPREVPPTDLPETAPAPLEMAPLKALYRESEVLLDIKVVDSPNRLGITGSVRDHTARRRSFRRTLSAGGGRVKVNARGLAGPLLRICTRVRERIAKGRGTRGCTRLRTKRPS
jgi:hypothetical protein